MPLAIGIAAGIPWLGRGAQALTPNQLSPSGWWDGLDQATLFLTDGTTPASIGATVGKWNDKSGFSNHLVQLTGGSQPTRSAFGLTYDGGDRFSATTLTQGALSQPYTWIYVCDNQANGSMFGDHGTGATRNLAQRGAGAATEMQIFAGSTLLRTGVPTLATRRAWFLAYNGASSTIKCGSGSTVAQQGAAGAAGANTCADVRMGGNASGFLLTGTGSREGMGEVILIPRLLTPAEELALYLTYLQPRHGIV